MHDYGYKAMYNELKQAENQFAREGIVNPSDNVSKPNVSDQKCHHDDFSAWSANISSLFSLVISAACALPR